ncbi:MAG: hypothetical protein ABIA04_02150 [Pseudomonadota bacterium]
MNFLKKIVLLSLFCLCIFAILACKKVPKEKQNENKVVIMADYSFSGLNNTQDIDKNLFFVFFPAEQINKNFSEVLEENFTIEKVEPLKDTVLGCDYSMGFLNELTISSNFSNIDLFKQEAQADTKLAWQFEETIEDIEISGNLFISGDGLLCVNFPNIKFKASINKLDLEAVSYVDENNLLQMGDVTVSVNKTNIDFLEGLPGPLESEIEGLISQFIEDEFANYVKSNASTKLFPLFEKIIINKVIYLDKDYLNKFERLTFKSYEKSEGENSFGIIVYFSKPDKVKSMVQKESRIITDDEFVKEFYAALSGGKNVVMNIPCEVPNALVSTVFEKKQEGLVLEISDDISINLPQSPTFFTITDDSLYFSQDSIEVIKNDQGNKIVLGNFSVEAAIDLIWDNDERALIAKSKKDKIKIKKIDISNSFSETLGISMDKSDDMDYSSLISSDLMAFYLNQVLESLKFKPFPESFNLNIKDKEPFFTEKSYLAIFEFEKDK